MYGMYGMYNSPPGLEHLTQVDQLLVHQLVEPYEGLNFIEINFKVIHFLKLKIEN